MSFLWCQSVLILLLLLLLTFHHCKDLIQVKEFQWLGDNMDSPCVLPQIRLIFKGIVIKSLKSVFKIGREIDIFSWHFGDGCFVLLRRKEIGKFQISTWNYKYSKWNKFVVWDHSLSMFAKLSENIYYPLIRKHMAAYQGVKDVSFLQNFVYVLSCAALIILNILKYHIIWCFNIKVWQYYSNRWFQCRTCWHCRFRFLWNL